LSGQVRGELKKITEGSLWEPPPSPAAASAFRRRAFS
jgi:hypothetical protein